MTGKNLLDERIAQYQSIERGREEAWMPARLSRLSLAVLTGDQGQPVQTGFLAA